MRLKLFCAFLIFLSISAVVEGGVCCHQLQLAGWWGDIEYLLLWRKARPLPPLVTTSPAGTPIEAAGVLGLPTTSILFGGESVEDSPRSGGRVDAGIWIYPCLGIGIGGFGVGNETISFSEQSNPLGLPILARPFFNALAGVQAASIVSFPGVRVGSISASTKNELWGLDAYLRYPFIDYGNLSADLLIGYYFTRLKDTLKVHARYNELLILTTNVRDRFVAKNTLNSVLVGLTANWDIGAWGAVVDAKWGIGSMTQSVEIVGQTNINGVILPVGLLAQPSNSGTHSRHIFDWVSEVSAKIHYQPCCWILLTAGYTYFYWPKVLLAGEQVDLNIDPTQAVSFPEFSFNQTKFWAHGFTLGLHVSF